MTDKELCDGVGEKFRKDLPIKKPTIVEAANLIRLNIKKLCVIHNVKREVLEFDWGRSSIAEMLFFTLTRNIASQVIREITYPETWWDAFKAKWFPCWLERKFPVKYKKWKAVEMYPRMSVEGWEGGEKFRGFIEENK